MRLTLEMVRDKENKPQALVLATHGIIKKTEKHLKKKLKRQRK